jgi:hypothetical protein
MPEMNYRSGLCGKSAGPVSLDQRQAPAGKDEVMMDWWWRKYSATAQFSLS